MTALLCDAPDTSAWHAPLTSPLWRPIELALHFGHVPPVPRQGVGAAIVAHVVREYGNDKAPGCLLGAMAAIESWNAAVFTGRAPAWASADVSNPWLHLCRTHPDRLRRALRRARESFDPDRPLPEAVLYLRGAVAAGIVLGDVPDPVHAVLDVVATWLGIGWEGARGELTVEGFRSALAAVGTDARDPADALARAVATLPATPGRDRFLLRPAWEPGRRSVATWFPMLVPLGWHARSPEPPVCLESVAAPWLPDVEKELQRLGVGHGHAADRAFRYLHDRGGKRIRPLLAVAGSLAVGVEPDPHLCALVEWLHQTSLLLDDIADASPMRRGAPTLHETTSVPYALAVGGLALARWYDEVASLPTAATRTLTDAAADLLTGQRDEAHANDEASCLGVMSHKTASLFRAAVSIGPVAAGAPPSSIDALARFGHSYGMAFQLVDDLLDLDGDPALLGKPVHQDARNRRATLPALSHPRPELARRLCRERVRSWCRDANDALCGLPPSPWRDVLERVSATLPERTS